MTGTFHIVLAMKPCDGGFAENALKHGVAGINIDETRIGFPVGDDAYEKGIERARQPRADIRGGNFHTGTDWSEKKRTVQSGMSQQGRFPANIIHDGSEAILAEFDKAGESKSSGGRIGNISKTSVIYGGGKGLGQDIAPEDVRGDPGYGDTGTPARFFKQVGELPEPEE
jgi:site-specific DNA-methyltransferase (adenine-specific)